jgi:hypothetical protein
MGKLIKTPVIQMLTVADVRKSMTSKAKAKAKA